MRGHGSTSAKAIAAPGCPSRPHSRIPNCAVNPNAPEENTWPSSCPRRCAGAWRTEEGPGAAVGGQPLAARPARSLAYGLSIAQPAGTARRSSGSLRRGAVVPISANDTSGLLPEAYGPGMSRELDLRIGVRPTSPEQRRQRSRPRLTLPKPFQISGVSRGQVSDLSPLIVLTPCATPGSEKMARHRSRTTRRTTGRSRLKPWGFDIDVRVPGQDPFKIHIG